MNIALTVEICLTILCIVTPPDMVRSQLLRISVCRARVAPFQQWYLGYGMICLCMWSKASDRRLLDQEIIEAVSSGSVCISPPPPELGGNGWIEDVGWVLLVIRPLLREAATPGWRWPELRLGRRDFFFHPRCAYFRIHSPLLTVFCFFVLFLSYRSHAGVFGRILVHEFHIFYRDTNWNLIALFALQKYIENFWRRSSVKQNSTL